MRRVLQFLVSAVQKHFGHFLAAGPVQCFDQRIFRSRLTSPDVKRTCGAHDLPILVAQGLLEGGDCLRVVDFAQRPGRGAANVRLLIFERGNERRNGARPRAVRSLLGAAAAAALKP